MKTLEQEFVDAVNQEIDRAGTRHGEYHRDFAQYRYREGAKALQYLRTRYASDLVPGMRILDLGGGNGGFLLPFAEGGEARCFWSDVRHAPELDRVVRGSGVRIHRSLADGASLPFRDGSFDLILYVETIEHVRAAAVGREIARILRPGGLCYITTPPRLRFLLQRDPHYGIPGLLLLPDSLQPLLFRLLRKGERYEVAHLFWSSRGLVRTMPGLRLVEVTSRNWAGFLRRFDWDWIIARRLA